MRGNITPIIRSRPLAAMTPFARLRPIALGLALACAVPGQGALAQPNASRLPNIGDGNSMSVAQERRLG